jgi:hypothetical protein
MMRHFSVKPYTPIVGARMDDTLFLGPYMKNVSQWFICENWFEKELKFTHCTGLYWKNGTLARAGISRHGLFKGLKAHVCVTGWNLPSRPIKSPLTRATPAPING